MNVTPDGMVRLTLDELLSLPIKHLASGIDTEATAAISRCGTPSPISGFTEWICEQPAGISLGWDWCLEATISHIRWRRVGAPRTNVILVSEDGIERSWEKNLEQLGMVVDAMPWTDTLPAALNTI